MSNCTFLQIFLSESDFTNSLHFFADFRALCKPGTGLKVVVVGLGALVVVGSSMKSSSRSSLAKLGLVRKSNEALMLGEGVVDFSGTAGVTLKVVALNRPPDPNSSSSYENDLKCDVKNKFSDKMSNAKLV